MTEAVRWRANSILCLSIVHPGRPVDVVESLRTLYTVIPFGVAFNARQSKPGRTAYNSDEH